METQTETETTPQKINMRRVNNEVVRASLEAAGLAVPDGYDPPGTTTTAGKKALRKAVTSLQEVYRQRGGVLMECIPKTGGCGGDSPKAMSACPFCGNEDEAEAEDHDAGSNGAVSLVVGTISDLDERVKRIDEIKMQAVASFWDLGNEVRAIYEQNLWELRKDPDGNPRYPSWNRFCSEELKFTSQYAGTLMDVSKAYTRDDAMVIGPTKLRLLLQVPDEHKAEFIERAKTLPRSELVEHVKKVTNAAKAKAAERGEEIAPRETGRQGFKAGKEKVVPPKGKTREERVAKGKKGEAAAKLGRDQRPGEGAVSITLLTRRSTVALYKRGKEDRAKRVSDEPWGKLELADGTFLTVRLAATPKSELKLIIEAPVSG